MSATAQAKRSAAVSAELRRKLDNIVDPQERAIIETELFKSSLDTEARFEKLEKRQSELDTIIGKISDDWSLKRYIAAHIENLLAGLIFGGAAFIASVSFAYWLVAVPPKQPVSTPPKNYYSDNFCVKEGESLVIQTPKGENLVILEGSCAARIKTPEGAKHAQQK